MKRSVFLTLLLILSIAFLHADPPRSPRLVIHYSITNIEKGYDHVSRLKVFVDGKLAGTSTEKKESKPGKLVIAVSEGNHTVTAVLESKYQSSWEEHTISNGYSIDCKYESTAEIKKDMVIKLVFDLDKGTQMVY